MGMRRWASFSYRNRPEATSKSAADRALTSGPGGDAADAVFPTSNRTRIKTTDKRIDVRRIPSSTPACTLYMYMPGKSNYEKTKTAHGSGRPSYLTKHQKGPIFPPSDRSLTGARSKIASLLPTSQFAANGKRAASFAQRLKDPRGVLPNAFDRGRRPAGVPSIRVQNQSTGRGGGSIHPG